MWPTTWNSDETAVASLFYRWTGARGQVWEYSVSHGRLLVRFHREPPEQMQSAFVLCSNCDEVQFVSHWQSAAPHVAIECARGGSRRLLFTDGARLRVVCGNVAGVELDCGRDWPHLLHELHPNA